nr:MAG TPA: hypothetical protein [Caudoviricetes sp.]
MSPFFGQRPHGSDPEKQTEAARDSPPEAADYYIYRRQV